MTKQTPLEVPESWLEPSKCWGIWNVVKNEWGCCFEEVAGQRDWIIGCATEREAWKEALADDWVGESPDDMEARSTTLGNLLNDARKEGLKGVVMWGEDAELAEFPV